jgi:hypothetical protein
MKSERSEAQPLDQKCWECGKAITDDEWVVNWGSCSECFSAAFQKYLDENPDYLEENVEPYPFDEEEDDDV